MAVEYTLSLVKPDAFSKGHAWHILQDIASSGLKIVATRMVRLTKEQAKQFYYIHRERPFYDGLTNFMSSGAIMATVLEGEGAVHKYRDLMGATDSKKAAAGTLRNKFGENIERNAVHGSDSVENAKKEINFFFSGTELATLGLFV